jgi:hypothetical protein
MRKGAVLASVGDTLSFTTLSVDCDLLTGFRPLRSDSVVGEGVGERVDFIRDDSGRVVRVTGNIITNNINTDQSTCIYFLNRKVL